MSFRGSIRPQHWVWGAASGSSPCVPQTQLLKSRGAFRNAALCVGHYLRRKLALQGAGRAPCGRRKEGRSPRERGAPTSLWAQGRVCVELSPVCRGAQLCWLSVPGRCALLCRRFSIAAFTKYDPVTPAVTFTTFSGKMGMLSPSCSLSFPTWLRRLEIISS